MGVNTEGSADIYWVGSHDSNISAQGLINQDVLYYKKCIFGALTIKVEDYILVANADAANPESIYECDIAKILYLYELYDEFSKKDPCRAIVQWYSRPQNIPHRLLDDDKIEIDFDHEVIEDLRPFDQDISIETIFRKCQIKFVSSEVSASTLLKAQQKTTNYPMFVCRYKLVKLGSRYKLYPLEFALSSEENVNNRTPVYKTPQRSTKKKTPKSIKRSKCPELEFINVDNIKVSPIKIINNSVVKRSKGDFSDHLNFEVKELNANYLTESPTSSKTTHRSPYSNVTSARRNLNISLENDRNSTTVLNYSIIKDTKELNSNEIKIKLRLSENQKLGVNYSNANSPDSSSGLKDSRQTSNRRHSTSNNLKNTQSDKLSTRKRSVDDEVSLLEETPSKKQCDPNIKIPDDRFETPSRRSILKTPNRRGSLAGTPKRNIQLSNIVEEVIFDKEAVVTPRRKNLQLRNIADEELETPKRRKSISTSVAKSTHSTPSKRVTHITPIEKMKMIREGTIAASIDQRHTSRSNRKSDLQLAREQLHVSAIPKCLPCRETEFENIYTFIEGKIQDQTGGCMYVSGVPGTGKTATVTEVIRCLQRNVDQQEIPDFEFIEINGMRLTEPRQAYVQIYKQLTGKTCSWEQAHSLLEKRFMTPSPRRKTMVLLVDELDILCNRRQDVVYNLLDWPTKSSARLCVVTIANTMDLPERLLMGKVTSRLGLTRLTFQPYSFKQLQEIVTARLCGSDAFKCDAIQLVARKVAAVSGDARRALDICRRATEIAEETHDDKNGGRCVSMVQVQQALSEMISSPKVQAIKNCSKLEQIFLQAVSSEVTRTGVEEITFMGAYSQMESIGAFMGVKVPVPGRVIRICAKLGAERLLICEHSRQDIDQKILLNASADDIHYALQIKIN